MIVTRQSNNVNSGSSICLPALADFLRAAATAIKCGNARSCIVVPLRENRHGRRQKSALVHRKPLGRPLTLGEVAEASGLSRFHLTRVFPAATGHSVFGYLRGRRLTEAARALVDGAPDILSVALDAGYGSHEAFTRAFRDVLGLTPEEVRARRSLENLPLRGGHSDVRPSRHRSCPADIPRGRGHADRRHAPVLHL